MQPKSKGVILKEIDEDLGDYGVDDASPSEVDIGNNGADVRGNEVESDKLNEAEGENVIAHGINQDQVNDDVITEDGREEMVIDKHINVREEEENDKVTEKKGPKEI
ncbi:hypothetical protein GH714_001943 [Hevea brasiliensis]|uniref:Uncharacterized protein n=1 Tax=Hevea brasiliensis TaxID=3981 RepID=A0A6A6KPT5_HEVBR|nr:hypothetical protein GH714_001943 [Hevea brasiliensis]